MPLELQEKILKGIFKMAYDEQVSKAAVMHHLKQIKAEIGKKRKKCSNDWYHSALQDVEWIIDKKITKLK